MGLRSIPSRPILRGRGGDGVGVGARDNDDYGTMPSARRRSTIANVGTPTAATSARSMPIAEGSTLAIIVVALLVAVRDLIVLPPGRTTPTPTPTPTPTLGTRPYGRRRREAQARARRKYFDEEQQHRGEEEEEGGGGVRR